MRWKKANRNARRGQRKRQIENKIDAEVHRLLQSAVKHARQWAVSRFKEMQDLAIMMGEHN